MQQKRKVMAMSEKPGFMNLECKNCGASLRLVDKRQAICPYCGGTFFIDEATGIIIDFKIDYEDSIKTRKTLHSVKSTFVLFFVVGIFLVTQLFSYHVMVQNSKISSSDERAEIEENGNLLRIFCKDIFDKEYEEITEEEFARIKYIKYESKRDETEDYDVLYYSFTDYEDCANEAEFLDTVETWTYDSEGVSWPSDFTMFRGLTRIDMKNTVGLQNQTYAKDAPISYVEVDSYLDAVSMALDPAKIKILHIDNDVFPDTIEGIEMYTNLEELKLDILRPSDTMDVSGLAACERLHSLHLDCAETYTGLEKISELENLENLYLNHVTLSECDFLSEMPKLRELSISTEENPNLGMLANLTGLRKLVLLNEEEVAVGELAKLETLTELEELEIATESEEIFAALAKFTGLKVLRLNYEVKMPVPGEEMEPIDLSVFGELTNLESFCFVNSDTCALSGAECLLNLPKLQSFRIESDDNMFGVTQVRLNPELLADNPTVARISLSWTSPVDAVTGETMGFEFLRHYPGIQTLNLNGCGITDLSFVKNCPDLRICSLRENNIEDYSPLLTCHRLEKVDIFGNPNTKHGLSQEVMVYDSFLDEIEAD